MSRRYTVVWLASASDRLAQIWSDAADRSAVASAADEIDRALAAAPGTLGEDVHEGLRRFSVPPLQVLYAVREADRVVEVGRVKRVAEN